MFCVARLRVPLLFTVVLSLLSVVLGGKENARAFGKPLSLKKALSLQEALKHPEKYRDQKVLLEGKIDDVCQMKGCWLMLSDGQRSIRMKFAGYSFFVPKDSRGKKVRAEGRLIQETLFEEMARHYAAEQSTRQDLSTIKGPQHVVSFEAIGVAISD